MKIRLANFQDLNTVLPLFKELDAKHIVNSRDFRANINEERYRLIFKRALNKESNLIFTVAEMNETVIGFVLSKIVYIRNNYVFSDKTIGEINYIIIQENFKKRGIGKLLLEDMEERLSAKGVSKIEIRVYDFIKELLLEKYGFEKN